MTVSADLTCGTCGHERLKHKAGECVQRLWTAGVASVCDCPGFVPLSELLSGWSGF